MRKSAAMSKDFLMKMNDAEIYLDFGSKWKVGRGGKQLTEKKFVV